MIEKHQHFLINSAKIWCKFICNKSDTVERSVRPANSHTLGVRLTQSPKEKMRMCEIFAPISITLYILSLIH